MVTSNRIRRSFPAAVWLLACAPACAALTETDARRAQMAVELLPRVLSVDLDADKKMLGDRCWLLLIFGRDQAIADTYAASLRQSVPRLRDRPVVVSTSRVSELASHNPPPAALLLVEPLGTAAFESARAYARAHQRLLFSPFAGDVERGADAGLYIGPRVLLHFNTAELDHSAIRIEPQVLRISRLHE